MKNQLHPKLKIIQASQVTPAARQLFGRVGGVRHTSEPIPQIKRQLIAQGDGLGTCPSTIYLSRMINTWLAHFL